MIDSMSATGVLLQQHIQKRSLSATQQLKEYEKRGYVFHGSTNPSITELRPRPTKDIDKRREFNNDTAVFATPLPAASIIFACMSIDKVPKGERKGTWLVYSTNGNIVADIPKRWQPYISTNSGYVYVLNDSTFTHKCTAKNWWQVKSKQPVKPTAIITVAFSDFERLGGCVIWKEDD